MPHKIKSTDELPQIIALTYARIKDLTGQAFGRLVVIGFVGTNKQRNAKWLCLCECGTHTVVASGKLTSGSTKSCGCLIGEWSTLNKVTHGMSDTSEYDIWCGIIARCVNPSCSAYHHYGGRGITVCDRWLHSFESFIEDMGMRPGKNYSIDRVDNSLGYSPDNCQWRTKIEQMNNTRRNRFVEFQGQTLTLAQWSRETGISPSRLTMRLRDGWSIERTLTTPTAK